MFFLLSSWFRLLCILKILNSRRKAFVVTVVTGIRKNQVKGKAVLKFLKDTDILKEESQ